MAKWEEYAETESGYEEALRRIATWENGELDLKELGLKKIPEELAKLANLATLDLSDNQIVDISTLTELTKLTQLLLSKNQILILLIFYILT